MTFRLLALACFLSTALALTAGAQVGSPRVDSRDLGAVKIGASSLLGIPMLAVERSLRAPRRTLQWDVMLSPWRSIDGYPFEFLIGTFEWRWYRREDRTGLYAGLHVGGAAFRLRRPDYRDTSLYQEGAGILGGGSVGYLVRSREGWTLDLYAGGGTVQSLYKGYDRLTGSRYDGAKLWNVSGEWIPYRIGAMVGLPRRRQ